MKKRWILKNEPADFKALAEKLDVSPVVVRCIRNRGPQTEDEMRSYLYADMDELYDPMLMPGVAEAVGMLSNLRKQSKATCSDAGLRMNGTAGERQTGSGAARIGVASDYDCDGICSGMILKKGLERIGFTVNIYTPDRVKEGYGLNKRIIDDAVGDGCDLLITCDNGIAANDAVSYAKEKGLSVIVTDHHEPQEELPEADVIIDPKADELMIADESGRWQISVDKPYPFKGLCGAGVAYKLIEAIYMSLSRVDDPDASRPEDQDVAADENRPEAPDADVQANLSMPVSTMDNFTIGTDLLELAAIATVADVMELVDENRIIVKYGLRALRHTENKGLRHLLKLLRLEDVPLKASDIGFRIGPTLNATGRIAEVSDAFGLLSEADELKAKELAEKLVGLNDRRKEMTEEGLQTALDILYRDNPDADRGVMEDVLVVYVPGVHESIVGLIAGKIKERFNHPTIVFTDGVSGDGENEKYLKGSGRSIKNYHMFDRLMEVKDLTTAFGGHEMAAGLTIPESNFDKLKTKLNKKSGLCAEDFVAELAIDLEVPLGYLSEKLIDELDKMGPFGVANPRPIFAQRDLKISHVYYMGAECQHLKLQVTDDKGTTLEAVAFSAADEFDRDVIEKYGDDELDLLRRGKSDKTLALAYQPSINEYRGFRSIQLNIVAWSF